MASEWVDNLIKAVKAVLNVPWWACLVAGTVIYIIIQSPSGVVTARLDKLLDEYGALAELGAYGLWLIGSISLISKGIAWTSKRFTRNAVKAALEGLNADEEHVIASMLRDGSPTYVGSPNWPSILLLQEKGILEKGKHRRADDRLSTYQMPKWLWQEVQMRKGEFRLRPSVSGPRRVFSTDF